MSRIITVTIPSQTFVTNLDDFDGEDWNNDEIFDYVVYPNISDELKYDWKETESD